MERTDEQRGLLARRRRRRHLHLRQRAVLRLDRRRCTSTSRCSAWSAPRPATGYWLFARDGGIFTFGDAQVLRLARRRAPHVAGRRDAAHADRPRLLDARRRRLDATPSATRASFGDIGGCTNYGGARRLLVDADGQGLLDRDGERQRDRVRRRAPARVPGPPQRLARRVDAQSVRRGVVRRAAAYTRIRTTNTHGELGGTGLRGWLAVHDRAPPPTPRTCSG